MQVDTMIAFDWQDIEDGADTLNMAQHPDLTLMRVREHVHRSDQNSNKVLSDCLRAVLDDKYKRR